MMRQSAILVSSLALLGTTIWTGCNANPRQRHAIGGVVTLDGKTLANGSIEFVPQDPNGISSGAVIKNGSYAIATIKGLSPGKYLVRIYATAYESDQKGAAAASPAPPGPPGLGGRSGKSMDLIPPKYNAQSKTYVDVVLKGDNRFDFTLASK